MNARRNGIELPLVLFALIALLTVALPSRERALLPLGDMTGFLAKSAADERLPDPFGYTLDDAFARTGFAVLDRSGRLLNPVLRSGGAGSRNRTRRIPGADRGGDVAIPEENSPNLGIIDGTALAVADGAGNPGGGAGNPGNGSGGPPDSIGGAPLPPIGGGTVVSPPGPAEPAPGPPPSEPVNPQPGPPPSSAVPEPMTWVLMILGFGLIGRVLRKRRTRGFNAESVRHLQ